MYLPALLGECTKSRQDTTVSGSCYRAISGTKVVQATKLHVTNVSQKDDVDLWGGANVQQKETAYRHCTDDASQVTSRDFISSDGQFWR